MIRFLVLIFLLGSAATAAPFTSAEQARVDAIVADVLAKTQVPSASVAVVRDGEIAFAKAYGRQRGDGPARSEARYPIASISKQFTAAALLLLAEERKLSLDDKVAKHLPGLAGADRVSVRQLLSHTSGYRDYWPQDYAFAAMARPARPQAILDRWAKAELDFTPGSQYQYSNTGYTAAGLIAEKVAGEPLDRFIARRLLRPARIDARWTDKGLARGDADPFTRFALGPVRPATPSADGWLYATGGLAMSAPDLARWNIVRLERRLLKPASWDEQEREVKTADGAGIAYGLGVQIDKARGQRRVRHNGAAVGFLSDNRVYPDGRDAVTVLVNADFGNAHGAIADRIEAMLVGEDASVARVRALYEALRTGALDAGQLTANGRYYFTPAVLADYRTSLGPLGAPESIARRGTARMRGGFTAEAFDIAAGGRKLIAVLRAEPNSGPVEQFTIYPAGD